MNAIELLYFLGFIGSALAIGWLLGKPFGAVGWWIGSVLGLVCWAGFLWRIADKRLVLGRPTCRHEKCSADGFRFLRMKDVGAEFQCRCGDKYFLKGNRFMTLDEHGVAYPYMRRKHTLRRWEKDDSPGPSAGS